MRAWEYYLDDLEHLASRELQERYMVNATKEEYMLPEDLWNRAADFVEHVRRFQRALAAHPDLPAMSLEEMARRSREETAPFIRSNGPFRDPLLTTRDVRVARSVPASAIPAVERLGQALDANLDVMKSAPSWTALVRESPGWAAIREAAQNYLSAVKDAAARPAD
jgi:hypothetical protein